MKDEEAGDWKYAPGAWRPLRAPKPEEAAAPEAPAPAAPAGGKEGAEAPKPATQ
jgi:hypothetical protein